ncbi:hypothetical protein [Ideonella sp. A 288]|uniref:hypothetical protein n=1 Tax=Ideonella sp. A 288 TaxID=1962181 RepID=UPI000B4B9D03|nr:hypothetical protein [Ideonella sp. A 288]
MRLHRRPARWLSGWLIAALLLMQLLASAHACTVVGAVAPAKAMAPMADMPGCTEAVDEAPVADSTLLCQVHCQQGSQTVHPTPAVDAPATPVLMAVLDWAPAALASTGTLHASPDVRSGAPPPGSPPLYLSLLVLRN